MVNFENTLELVQNHPITFIISLTILANVYMMISILLPMAMIILKEELAGKDRLFVLNPKRDPIKKSGKSTFHFESESRTEIHISTVDFPELHH